jgi:hypothetical protein
MRNQCHLSGLVVSCTMLTTALAPRALHAQAERAPRPAASETRLEVVRPSIALTWTTGLPDARGGGGAMSGVGIGAVARAGLRGMIGPFRYRIAPELVVNENRDFHTFASADPTRDPFASPFYHGDFSADLPSRPGDARRLRILPGESGIWWSGRRAFAALSSSTPAWGPASPVGEGLVLGRSAPGLPRMELGTSWRVGSGLLRLRWLGGVASESEWFDDDPDNDQRIVSGARLEFERGERLVVGAARTVMNAAGRDRVAALLQPFSNASETASMEMLSADVRLNDVRSGTTAWLELARQAPMTGAGDFLRQPTEGLAFRTGLSQRLGPATAEYVLSMEFLRLDQPGTRTDRDPNDLYTSAVVSHGWTHRGQPLGSGVGPGGQRQLAGLDRLGRRWRLGLFAERVRWNEDALFRTSDPASDRHDVTLRVGLVASRVVREYEVTLVMSGGKRLNYLFQGASVMPGGQPVDVGVMRLGLSLSPAGSAQRIVGVFSHP